MSTNRKPAQVWHVEYDGLSLSIDDMTWAEVEAIEQSTGVAWSILNPWRSASVAQALLAVLLVRNGRSDAEAAAVVGSMTARDFKGCFSLHDDDRPDYYDDGGLPVTSPKADTGEPTKP